MTVRATLPRGAPSLDEPEPEPRYRPGETLRDNEHQRNKTHSSLLTPSGKTETAKNRMNDAFNVALKMRVDNQNKRI